MVSMTVVWALVSGAISSRKQKSDLTTTILKSEDAGAAAPGVRSSKAQDSIKDESDFIQDRQDLYNIKPEDEEVTPDSSDAEHEARMGALVTDHHLDAEDEEEDEEESKVSPPALNRIKDEKDEDEQEKFRDSGIGTSMESEVAASGSGLMRRRSGRDSSHGNRNGGPAE
jgi:hypothetical protein